MAVAEKILANEIFAEGFSKIKSESYIHSIRESAFESFIKQGIPTKKNEEYKYSPAQYLFNKFGVGSSELVVNVDIKKYFVPSIDAYKVVLINGVYSEELSDKNFSKGLVVKSFSKAIEENKTEIETHFSKYANVDSDAFVAMNTAFATDGTFISVSPNSVIEKPIHIVNFVSSNSADINSLFFSRNLFLIGKNSQLSIFETSESIDKSVLNSVTEIFADENSKTQYYKLQNSNSQFSNSIETIQVKQKANSHFDTNTITLGGAWVRNNLSIVLDGPNCDTHLNGLFVLNGNQHIDNHTLVDHKIHNCQSNQLYKGILSDKSTGIFNGKIFVRKDAQKTNAYQSSKNILLNDDATINTKPQLEIYADDVKCSHGSSTGQIDEEALFYLRSRGLSVDSAKKLLLNAFANDVLNTIRNESIKNYLEEIVNKRLEL